jgi:hypothetical protein
MQSLLSPHGMYSPQDVDGALARLFGAGVRPLHVEHGDSVDRREPSADLQRSRGFVSVTRWRWPLPGRMSSYIMEADLSGLRLRIAGLSASVVHESAFA